MQRWVVAGIPRFRCPKKGQSRCPKWCPKWCPKFGNFRGKKGPFFRTSNFHEMLRFPAFRELGARFGARLGARLGAPLGAPTLTLSPHPNDQDPSDARLVIPTDPTPPLKLSPLDLKKSSHGCPEMACSRPMSAENCCASTSLRLLWENCMRADHRIAVRLRGGVRRG